MKLYSLLWLYNKAFIVLKDQLHHYPSAQHRTLLFRNWRSVLYHYQLMKNGASYGKVMHMLIGNCFCYSTNFGTTLLFTSIQNNSKQKYLTLWQSRFMQLLASSLNPQSDNSIQLSILTRSTTKPPTGYLHSFYFSFCRFDCLPGLQEVSEASCVSKGCVWDPVGIPGVPHCFFPDHYPTYKKETAPLANDRG